MKLAVRKEEGSVPGGGFHYMLHPLAMKSDFEVKCFQSMGHIIIEVPDEKGQELLKAATQALLHQCEVAVLTYDAEKLEEE